MENTFDKMPLKRASNGCDAAAVEPMTDDSPEPRRSRNLVAGVIETLRAELAEGAFRPGDKLPSESQLTEKYGVSRTVIREAIAGLRADGLVEPRQGAGVFVLEPAERTPRPFQILNVAKVSSVLEMLELRAAVEMEAAALAAVRRSPAQEETILDACRRLLRLAEAGQRTSEADLEFHLAIADATNNPRFREFLEIMGISAIPRAVLRPNPGDTAESSYIERISSEHLQVAHAISCSDPEAAREAMRKHLKGSQQRYRELIHQRV